MSLCLYGAKEAKMRPTSLTVVFFTAMVLFIPICLSALFSGGTGTETDPFLIANATDLNNVRSCRGYYFLQTSDIDLNVAPYNVGQGWNPIGSAGYNDLDYYDGGGHKIIGLTMHSPSYMWGAPKGLFEGLHGGYVRNLTLENFDIISVNAGALAQRCSGTQIENCHVSGVFSNSGSISCWIGGLVSEADNSSSFYNCTARISTTVQMLGEGFNVGGIVGIATDSSIDSCRAYVNMDGCLSAGGLAAQVHNSTVTRSCAVGTITNIYETGGGLIGEIFNSDVSCCYANLEMVAITAVMGGLAGCSNSGSVISNCHADVWFEGNSPGALVSGLIGFIGGTQITNCYAKATQNDAYCSDALGTVFSDASVINCYYNSDLITSGEDAYWDDSICGRTSDDMTWPYAVDTYVGWDFQNVWESDPNYMLNSGYPRLRDFDYSIVVPPPGLNYPSDYYNWTLVFEINCSDPDAEIHYTLDGSKPDIDSPLYTEAFIISTSLTVKSRAFKQGLCPSAINISEILTSPAYLPGSGTVQDPYRISWGNQLLEMNVHLDSHFALVQNVHLEYYGWHFAKYLPIGKYSGANSPDNSPFTGSLDGRGHRILGGQIIGSYQGANGIFAYCNGAKIHDLQVCLDSVQGNSNTGYLAGVMVDCEVSRCLAYGNVVSGNGNAGLLIGKAENCIIDQCYSSGSVTGGVCNGGLIGSQINGTVTDCYGMNNLSGAPISGGLIGSLNGSGQVKYCYSTGIVSGWGAKIGGLIGSGDPDMVTNSYWDTQKSRQTRSAGGTACTTAQMRNGDTYQNWDFQHVWLWPNLGYNQGYPLLINTQMQVSIDELVPTPQLLSLWPNPFHDNLELKLELLQPAKTVLSVFNVRGQEIKRLLSGTLNSGKHDLIWDGKDEQGNRVASGIYFIRIETNGVRQVHKCLLLK